MKGTFNFIAGMIVGSLIGAAAALFLAPQSGEELRASIQERAAVERRHLQDRFEEKVSQIQTQLDNVNKDAQTMLEKTKRTEQSENAPSKQD